MEKALTIDDWKRKIINATPTQLVLINYELILHYTNKAKIMLEKKNYNEFYKEINSARQFLSELMGSLDMKLDISYNLLNLFFYINKRFVSAYIKKDASFIDEAEKILIPLYKEFCKVEPTLDTDQQPAMYNTQSVYAGLTYGKNSLNELVVNPGEKRGFEV